MTPTSFLSIESWKPVAGFEGRYEVSDLGRVRSLQKKTPRILRPGATSTGHLTVALGRGKSRTVHSLVAEAFIGPRPQGQEVRHLDGDEKNNRVVNLAYGTRSQNGQDKKWHRGCLRYRITPDAARQIKEGLNSGVRGAELARVFGVSQSAVSAIKHGRTHRDVL